ncbi:Bardet-Biedl syndrome 5 protein homolog isoform X2 [Trichogramma pretiosum]|uniref:Bardet-Biedl syndrome 5 protein homolog isoform X2 n=1 Tax=Trichogramma pretiosum TaxID=7493 RepID=UPI0006C9A294|nr:Bardet-Biedl syndrome 5 protein homolog isoform X2 [Trichogramma pretiosum]
MYTYVCIFFHGRYDNGTYNPPVKISEQQEPDIPFFLKAFLNIYPKMWQDNQVKFDVSLSQMEMRSGEYLIDKLDMIEDTKGNSGDRGRLLVTNLRIMWHSIAYPRVNLSIGFNTFDNLFGTTTQALYVLTSYKNCRYEFIFSNMNNRSSRHYTSVMGVYRAYVSSKIYREIKLRAGIILNGRLSILPQEIIELTTAGVWNLSTDQGNVGTFIISNVRIVWYAEMNEQFNVSMPYLTINSINIRSSKFGPTLVITTTESSGSFILGFRVDPSEELRFLHSKITSIYETYSKSPIFGVEYTFEHESIDQAEVVTEQITETDITEDEISNVFSVYFSEGEVKQRKPMLAQNLGLSVEEPKEGSTLEMLWELFPTNK